MTLAELQQALTDLSAEMLQAATSLQQANAKLHYQVVKWRETLREIRDTIGDAEQPN